MTIDDEDVAEEKITKENVNENKELTLGEAAENYDDFGVTYEIPPQRSRRLNDVKIVNHADEEVVGEKVEVKEEVSINKNINNEIVREKSFEENKNKDSELTDDLFNLIDSMYKERND